MASTRAQDREALRRFHDHLEPGGTLVLDNEVPYSDADVWRYWPKGSRTSLPEPFEPSEERHLASDGAEYSLAIRVLDVDPLEQCTTLEMHAEMWRDGELVSEEDHALTARSYFRDELVLMLERAGFEDIVVHGGYTEEEATADHDFLVFVARSSGRTLS